MTRITWMCLVALIAFPGCTRATDRDDDAHLRDGSAHDGDLDGARFDGGRWPDGATLFPQPVPFDSGPEPLADGATLDAFRDASIDALGFDAFADAWTDAYPTDTNIPDGSRRPDGEILEVGPTLTDGAPPFEAGTHLPDASGIGPTCGAITCPEGLRCCPISGMCVPFGCAECCDTRPPPPPPPPSF